MPITILAFIFPIYFTYKLFGQILSQSLLFSKLTGIWHWAIFLYADYDFDI